MSELRAITDADFDQEVLQAATPVAVDFWAEWCGPCRMMAPILDKLAVELEGTLTIVKMDVQENPKTAASLGVMNIPTLILFVKGHEKERLTGYAPLVKVKKKLAAHL